MQARAMFWGVSGMGSGISFLTGRPRGRFGLSVFFMLPPCYRRPASFSLAMNCSCDPAPFMELQAPHSSCRLSMWVGAALGLRHDVVPPSCCGTGTAPRSQSRSPPGGRRACGGACGSSVAFRGRCGAGCPLGVHVVIQVYLPFVLYDVLPGCSVLQAQLHERRGERRR